MRACTIVMATIFVLGCGSDGGGDTDASDTVDDTTLQDTDTPDEAPDTPGETGCVTDGDCDDDDPCTADTCDVGPGTCSHDPVDADGDDHTAMEVDGTECAGGTDCDDSDEDIHPGAPPDCTGEVDMNCDGLDDSDEDGDGYRSIECGGEDCSDIDVLAFPGSTDLHCELDRDCNDLLDADNDDDGYDRIACEGTDCDDENADVNPDASEIICNGIDDDCNGAMSSDEDEDQDGYANETCAAEGADVDCDDTDDTNHPGATATCDMVDDDCSGSWQDEAGADDDSDGYLDMDCDGGDDCDDTDDTNHPGADNDDDGYTDARCGGDDCDDFDPLYNPGMFSSCTTEDRNCNGNPDQDDDGDGHDSYMCTGGDDCDDTDDTVVAGECEGVNECCDGCFAYTGCFKDPVTGHVWEYPPLGGVLSLDDAAAYCASIDRATHGPGEWRLPTISELRTLVHGCAATQTGGSCGVTDACLDASCADASCDGCTDMGGPATGGCYWDSPLDSSCVDGMYWTSSLRTDDSSHAWIVDFGNAQVTSVDVTDSVNRPVRCIVPGS